VRSDVTLEDGGVHHAWVYFYNAPLGQAQRIPSGDYLDHLGGDRPLGLSNSADRKA
jgi:gamma-glutamylcyclotransferase (GGCT)/AIG2-like uncharacterized protein YtfP